MDTVIEAAGWEAARALPLLGKVFQLHDQITSASDDAAEEAEAHLEAVREGDVDLPAAGPALKLDGLHDNPAGGISLHVGRNDLENGESAYPDGHFR
ncbi:hypothetical protein AB4Z54_18125 [Streptomyces sp. MCAF7]